MSIKPISFGSLLCFTLKDGKPKAPVPSMVMAAFRNNPGLKMYKLDQKIRQYKGEDIDGTVYNATGDFGKLLDKKYAHELPKGSNKVLLTEADFFVNPRQTEKRYFITAATYEDERKILDVLSKTNEFYTAKINGGKGY